MGIKSSSLKHTFWFTFLGLLRPAIHIFLLPLYLLKISPAEYGILSMVLIFASLVASISGLKLDVAANTFYYDYYNDRNRLYNYLGQIFTINFVIALCFFSFLFLSGSYIFELIFVSEEIRFFPFGIISVAVSLFAAANAIYFSYLKNELKIKEFVSLNIFIILSTIFIQAILILKYHLGILGILWGSLIPLVCVFLFLIVKNTWLINFRLDFKFLKPSFIFGLGFLPISFLLIFEKQIDRIFIERFLDLEKVGIYSLLLSIIGIFLIFLGAYQTAIRPQIYKSLKNPVEKTIDFINEQFKYYTSVGVMALAFVFLIGSHLQWITDNPKYLDLLNYLPAAILATIPLIVLRFQVLIILFFKKTFQLSIATVFKTLIMILMMYYLIPKYGVFGAIMALFISQLSYLLSLILVQRQLEYKKMDYLHSFYRTILFSVLVGLHFMFVPKEYYQLSSIIIFIIVLISFLMIERSLIKAIMKKSKFLSK